MKRLLTLLALVLCSCAETFVGEEIARPNNENLPDLTASFADKEATRTYIEEGKYLRWNEDDRLTIFYGNTLNRQYKFNGATGDNSGTFSLVPSDELGTGNAFDHIYALYPYNADARISDEGVISLTLSAVQNYAENSFGRGANTMIAVTENLEDTFLAFKNACGYLKLKLYNAEGATIKRIEVKGNSGERLAGAATATIAFGEAPVLAMADDATTSVTLDCGEGVALGTTAETATEFWVTLPATTFAEGLTITATDTEGGVFEKSTTNEVIIERNAIQPMAVLETEFLYPTPRPANNEIWYTNGNTTEATTPNKTNVFGANIVSNTYDVAKGCWVIKFDGEVTTIGERAFFWCSSLTSLTIPDSVTEIGNYAFRYCSSLTSVNIPDSVTTIGYYAFERCISLISVNIPDSVTTIGDYAFYGCDSLTSVTIPDSVTTIGYMAFCDCDSLQEFNGKFASEDGRCLIIDGVLNSFAPAGLTEYTIPDSVTTIGYGAFAYCSSLTSVTIPDSVTTIGDNAFYSCSSLTSVYCKAITPPAGGSSMFSFNASGRKIYVPMKSVEAYKSAQGWSDYADIIVAYDFEKGEVVPDVLKPANNEIWYTNGSTTEATTPYKTDVFGANIVSNTYDAEKECWVITFDDDVTSIGASAFMKCSSLTSVTIPDSVTSIGYQAFNACSSLISATIPDSVTSIRERAFLNCSSLIAFYGNLASADNRCLIVDGALNSFAPANLTEYTIPDGVTSIGMYAFSGCSGLISVTIPNSVTLIRERAFNGCSGLINVTIPNSVTSIENYAFNACGSLKSVTIGNSVNSIGNYAFYACSSLKSVTIGNSVTSIEYHAFDGCSGLTSVHISNLSAWCKIDFGANIANPLFYAKNLYLNGNLVAELTIPSDITEIKNYAFYGCSSLTGITISDSVTSIGDSAFYGCSGLISVTIPDSVTTIGSSAFGNCSNLTSITIPDRVTSIGNSAFTWCTSLASVTIPDSVTYIGENAFYNCSSLTSATIGNSVNSIGWDAFSYCGSLTSVYCKPTTPPTGNDHMFYNHSSRLKIYVPRNSVSAYKSIYASGWSEYASYIVGYDF
ncbi:MAG: leucine-rich repeat domain-containing protein [Alistipes sp.]|nr:leucine-rich repeat domain-containing protein [Alistipes sp.]